MIGTVAMVWFRNFYLHELAMQTSCALAYAALTIRLLLPIAIFTDFEVAYGVFTWLCWTINLFILFLLQRTARTGLKKPSPCNDA